MSRIVKRLFVLIVLCVLGAAGNRIYSGGEVINNALHFKETNEAKIDRSSVILVNRANQFRHKIVAKRNNCSRYCIENEENKSYIQNKKVHLMWYISQESLDFNNDTTSSADKFADSKYSQSSDKKCSLRLSIGCENFPISTTDNEKNYFEILRHNELTEYSSNKFNIDEEARELQLKIVGNVAWIFLEMPAGENRTEPLDLTLVRDNDKNEVNLVANNPPPGGWLLKLRGRENSTYSLIARQVLPPESSRLIPVATNDDDFIEGIDEDGIVIYLEDPESTPQSRQASLIFDEESLDLVDKKNLPGAVVFREPLEELSKLQIEENTDSELGELSRASNLITRGSSLPVDLAQETSLLARPGSIHTVAFVVSNNQPFEILHVFQARSTQLQIVGIDKPGQWLRPGETTTVRVNLLVPTVDENAINSVTLHVERGQNLQAVEKSAYIYVQSSTNAISDSTKPTIDYEFSNNCAGRLRLERCENSFWSVEITVTDDDSGLKTVTSRPSGVYPRREFIAGTKNAVNFLYVSTCCETTVDVTAIDVAGNSYTRTIDVNAWDNLTTGEIAAIVVGSLFLLLIIVLLILLCIYCARKRKSADISYTQRYGSRAGPTSRTEGTNF